MTDPNGVEVAVIAGRDYRLRILAAPDGLTDAFALVVEGNCPAASLEQAHRHIFDTSGRPDLNLIVELHAFAGLIDLDGFTAIFGAAAQLGISRINVVCIHDSAAFRKAMDFADEVARIEGLEVKSRLVWRWSEAAPALAELMADC